MSDEILPLDSASKMAELKRDFEDDGILKPENVKFVFTYVSALEMALEFSAGAGDTQAESDAKDASREDFGLKSYIEEAVEESNYDSEKEID